MSHAYEEILEGETVSRQPPGTRHEQICNKLHARVAASIAGLTTTRLLPHRDLVQISAGTLIRPDLALVTAATGKVWLVAEIVDAGDHRVDTVMKKQIYEETKLPRLWMIDPRYDNVEVYHCSPYGLALRNILAGKDALTESLLPEFRIVVNELFGP